MACTGRRSTPISACLGFCGSPRSIEFPPKSPRRAPAPELPRRRDPPRCNISGLCASHRADYYQRDDRGKDAAVEQAPPEVPEVGRPADAEPAADHDRGVIAVDVDQAALP